MKIAAVDIGSNSIHMIVAEIDAEGAFAIIDRQKEMARLGERSLIEGALTPEAIQRGLDALARFKRVADGYGVAEIIGVATSAVRESRNGDAFIQRVRDEIGVDARIIDGEEEGHLIYLGAREVFDLGGRRALIVDIGGGSVELILADRLREHLVFSVKLGVRRLHEAFLRSDPPSPSEIERLRSHVRATLADPVREVVRRGFDVVLASSGTARALARITAARTGGSDVRVTIAELDETVRGLAAMPAGARADMPGVDDRRRDAILEGGVLLQAIVSEVGADAYTYCDAALREGMIVDYLERNRPGLRAREVIRDPRRRAVALFARRFRPSPQHGEHTAQLATQLFDALTALHGLPPETRDLLEYAALMHDVGTAVSRSSYHKHSQYVIENADLEFLGSPERRLVAQIARYHRRSLPKPRHEAFAALPPDDQSVVWKLSALLRLANALDLRHGGVVTRVRCTVHEHGVVVTAATSSDAAPELRASSEATEHFETAFGIPAVVVAES